MDYISTKEASKALGVTERWIQMQCKSGKIEGAVQFNDRGVWLVPKYWVNNKSLDNNQIIKER